MTYSTCPVLAYPAPQEAADWACRAFDYSIVRQEIDDAGVVARIWLHADDGFVLIELAREAAAGRRALTYVAISDPELSYERLVDISGTVCTSLAVTADGSTEFEVTDPWGHGWRVSSRDPWDIV